MLLPAAGYQSVSADEKLPAGKWSGEFVTHEDVLYDIEYRVSYTENAEILDIKMINLNLGASKFTDQLSGIEIDDKMLRFKIERKFETKACELEFDEGIYRGKCISDAGDADEFSTITMEPPASVAASDDDK